MTSEGQAARRAAEERFPDRGPDEPETTYPPSGVRVLQRAAFVDGYLAAARRTPEPAVVEVHHHDIERHAASFTEGYETAVAQGLADDPTLARDWLAERDARMAARAAADALRRFANYLDGGTPRAWGFHHPCDPPGVRWEPSESERATMLNADLAREEAARIERDAPES